MAPIARYHEVHPGCCSEPHIISGSSYSYVGGMKLWSGKSTERSNAGTVYFVFFLISGLCWVRTWRCPLNATRVRYSVQYLDLLGALA